MKPKSIPFNQPNINRPLYPKSSMSGTEPEGEKVSVRKVLIEATIAVFATLILQEVILKKWFK
jgi:hypothetical protein